MLIYDKNIYTVTAAACFVQLALCGTVSRIHAVYAKLWPCLRQRRGTDWRAGVFFLLSSLPAADDHMLAAASSLYCYLTDGSVSRRRRSSISRLEKLCVRQVAPAHHFGLFAYIWPLCWKKSCYFKTDVTRQRGLSAHGGRDWLCICFLVNSGNSGVWQA